MDDVHSPPILITGGTGYKHRKNVPPSTYWEESPGANIPNFDPTITTSVTLADVNADGLEDVIVTATNGHSSQIFLNPGNDVFSDVTPTPIAGTASVTTTSVEVVDVNGDQIVDLVLGNSNAPNQVIIGSSQSLGDFSTASVALFGSSTDVTKAVRVSDIDADGVPDIIVANDGQTNKVYFGTLGSVSGDYSSPNVEVSVGTEVLSTSTLELGDLDGDGNVDIVFGNRGSESEIFWNPQPIEIRQTLPAAIPTNFGSSVMSPNDITVADVDSDGRLDIISANDGGNTIMYGSSTYDYTVSSLGTASEKSLTVHVFDSDGDGNINGVVFGNVDGSATTHHIVDNQFVEVERVGGRTRALTQQLIADFNSDGVPDILSGRQIMLGDGTGDFSATVPSQYAPETPRATTAMDIDNDGDVDLVVSSTSGDPTVYALLNPGTGDFSQVSPVVLGGLTDGQRTVEMKPIDFDGDGYTE